MSIIMPHIDALTTYALGEQPPEGVQSVKLNQNESPYPPAPSVLQALRDMNEEELRRYPDAACSELRETLSAHLKVDKEQLFCGNGSSEIISLIFKVFIGPGGSIAVTDPTFGLYHTVAASFQAGCKAIPTRDDFTVDVDVLLASGAKAIVLVNPNAPTGLLLSSSEVERLVSGFAGLVVIDEAYIDFAEPGASSQPLLAKYTNLLILRTFSKAYALCGARVGYCMADRALITALEKGRDIYNVNSISRKLAIAAIRDEAYVKDTIVQTNRSREKFILSLRELGFEVLPSQTNFVLCAPPIKEGLDAKQMEKRLAAAHIFVRHFDQPRLRGMLRISIGTESDMKRLLAELVHILA
ncbi:histidinol-phosphate transaminase [Paenibacillus mendelii]|uniref:Histidinol-phosphate aminotransferase n=1 Tax=Paenibacillus mendelii TaxID=206163 RepID=A0ABV6J8S6_9BACL|nr:histidinol-phosphate transaminase [Paenibacillus mendelii]MCQ6559634.1 histidinol-phosphate transaminase [Paenibacillus mendelii]